MPHGGHNRKSIEQHIADGTYRPGRHGPKPMKILRAPVVVDRCAVCGDPESDDSPLGFHDTGAGLCPGCALSGVIYFAALGWDMVPDEIRDQIIAEYLEEHQAGAS